MDEFFGLMYTMDDGFCRIIGKILWSWTFNSIVMACTWWRSLIEAYLVIVLSRCGYYYVIEMCRLCEGVRLCLRCNDIRLVINYLCTLLWHDDDDNVLISHMKCHIPIPHTRRFGTLGVKPAYLTSRRSCTILFISFIANFSQNIRIYLITSFIGNHRKY